MRATNKGYGCRPFCNWVLRLRRTGQFPWRVCLDWEKCFPARTHCSRICVANKCASNGNANTCFKHTFWNRARVAENCAPVAANCARVAGSRALHQAAGQPEKVLELGEQEKALECQKLSGALVCVSKNIPGGSGFCDQSREKGWAR